MDITLELSDLAEVQNFLINLEYKWYDIGLQLGLDPGRLECIKQSGKSNAECLILMLQLWLKGVGPEPTWGDLCRVLAGRVVQEQKLAVAIRREKDPEACKYYLLSGRANVENLSQLTTL